MQIDDTFSRCDRCRVLVESGVGQLVELTFPEAKLLDLCVPCAVEGRLSQALGQVFRMRDGQATPISYAEALEALGLGPRAGRLPSVPKAKMLRGLALNLRMAEWGLDEQTMHYKVRALATEVERLTEELAETQRRLQDARLNEADLANVMPLIERLVDCWEDGTVEADLNEALEALTGWYGPRDVRRVE